jgi:hypothetical protein
VAGLVAPVSRGIVTLQPNSVGDVPVINLNVSAPSLPNEKCKSGN